MSNIGEKRPAASSSEHSEGAVGAEKEEETLPSAPKRPAPSFNFRPSLLQQATQGFSLKQSSLPSSLVEAPKPKDEEAKAAATPLQSGFLKLDSNELKPISGHMTSLGAPSPSTAAFGLSTASPTNAVATTMENSVTTNQINHSSEGTSDNLFLQFMARMSSANSFSSVSAANSASAMSTTPQNSNLDLPANPATAQEGRGLEVGREGEEEEEEEDPAEAATAQTAASLNGSGASDDFPGGGGLGEASGMFQGATAILPEVHVLTGEEKEKKIVQVPARLYAFDISTHNWKERGRGEVRLNDAAQSEGLFQSRLVMRASGSYRVLLNTHLWAQMKCERANQKSIRITAQHEDQVAVFLITGATKDIQQLFTAIDRRIEALRRNQTTTEGQQRQDESSDPAHKHATPISSSATTQLPEDEYDKESFLGDAHSSPDSSPDCHASTSRTRLAAAAVKTVGVSSGRGGGGGESGEGVGPTSGGMAEEERKKDKDVVVVVVTDEGAGSSVEARPGGGRRRGSGGGREEESPSDKESTSATPPSSRSPSLGRTSTTTISSSDNAPEANFSQ